MDERKSVTIGRSIRSLRAYAGMEQADLAHRVGVSAPMLCLIESDKRRVSLELASAIARLFGITIDELFLGTWANVVVPSLDDADANESKSRASTEQAA